MILNSIQSDPKSWIYSVIIGGITFYVVKFYYKVNGKIRDRFVWLELVNKNKNTIAYSYFLVEVVGDGTKMLGYRSFYALRKGEINAVECIMSKER